MSFDPFTSRNPSYCFVNLGSKQQSVRAVLELHGESMLGRPLNIKACTICRKTRPKDIMPAFYRWTCDDARDHWEGYSEQGWRLYIGGLPRFTHYYVSEGWVQTFMEGYEMYVLREWVYQRDSDIRSSEGIVKQANLPTRIDAGKHGNHHYLFVDLVDSNKAKATIEALDGRHELGGRIRVGLASGASRKVNER
jgi:hypothetical protein